MAKQHRDFVILMVNGLAINALVVASQIAVPSQRTDLPRSLRDKQPAAEPVELLTLMYLDPNSAKSIPSGDQVRDSVRIVYDVAPVPVGPTENGWKDIVDVVAETERIEGSPREQQDPESYARLLYTKSQTIDELVKKNNGMADDLFKATWKVTTLESKVTELIKANAETIEQNKVVVDGLRSELAEKHTELVAAKAVPVLVAGADAVAAAGQGAVGGEADNRQLPSVGVGQVEQPQTANGNEQK